MKAFIPMIFAACLLAASAGHAAALEVTVSQSGADSDEVMKSRAFTVEVTGWEGDCTTAQISFAGCSGCDLSGEEETKSVGEDTTITWTTVTASQKDSAQDITVSLSGGCTMESDDSSPFDVVLPPSLSITASTEATIVSKGEEFDVSIEVVNDGETTANSVVIEATTSGFTADCSQITALNEEQSSAQVCSVSGTGIVSGTKTVTIEVSASNADSATDAFQIELGAAAGDGICDPGESATSDCTEDEGGGPGGGSSGGIGGAGPAVQNRTRAHQMSPGLLNNTRLQAAIERALGQSRISEQARQNMMQLSARITGDFSSSHGFTYDGAKSRISNTVRYSGRNRVRNFVLFEKVPKEFAQSASLVTVRAPGGSVEVAEEDPSWAILYPEVNPGDVLTVTYEVTGVKSGGTLENITMEVYAESLEEAPTGGTDGTDGEGVPGEVDDSAGPAGQGAKPGGLPFALDTNTMLMIGAGVLALVVVVAAAVLLRKKKGGSAKAPAPASAAAPKQPPAVQQSG